MESPLLQLLLLPLESRAVMLDLFLPSICPSQRGFLSFIPVRDLTLLVKLALVWSLAFAARRAYLYTTTTAIKEAASATNITATSETIMLRQSRSPYVCVGSPFARSFNEIEQNDSRVYKTTIYYIYTCPTRRYVYRSIEMSLFLGNNFFF